MEHLYKFFERKRLNPIETIKDSFLTVSLKVDGQAFQIVNENGNITFHKRSGKATNIGPELTEIDFYFNKIFRDTFNFFKKAIPIFNNNIHIINFEILMDDTHVIQYKNLPKNGICLLNIIDNNNQELPYNKVSKLAKILNVGIVPVFYEGYGSEINTDKLKYLTETYCNPNNPTINQNFIKDVFSILGDNVENTDADLLKTKNNFIEGFVFNINYHGKLYPCKLDDPMFMITWHENNIDESEKEKHFDEIKNIFYNLLSQRNNLKHISDNHLENLIINFDNNIGINDNALNEIFKIYNANKSDFSYLAETANLIPQKYINKSEAWKISLNFWILFFNKTRIHENILNPFILKMGK